MVEPENVGLLLQASLSFPSRISDLQGPVYSGDARWQNYLNAALISEPVPGVQSQPRSKYRLADDGVSADENPCTVQREGMRMSAWKHCV